MHCRKCGTKWTRDENITIHLCPLCVKTLEPFREDWLSQCLDDIISQAKEGEREGQSALAACYATGNNVGKDLRKAIKWYLAAAKQGDVTSYAALGRCYQLGLGVEADIEKAIHFYQKAANEDHEEASYNLAVCYEYGLGVPKSMMNAIVLYEKSAVKNYPPAIQALGLCYEFGTGVPEDFEKALEFYQQGDLLDHGDSTCALARLKEQGKILESSPSEAFAHYQDAMEKGSAMAAFHVGRCYEEGIGTQKDWVKAKEAYEVSAYGGYANGEFALGVLAAKSKPVHKDVILKHYQRASFMGCSSAQLNLGMLYLKGAIVTKNVETAVYWIEKSAIHGNPEGELLTAKHYAYGIGVTANEKLALEWLKRSANQHYPRGEYALGKYYLEGIEKSKVLVTYGQLQQAVKFLERAAKHLCEAQYDLGKIYYNHPLVKNDMETAIYWLEQAASNGHLKALNTLGIIYENGTDIPVDIPRAISCYEIAAMRGELSAQYNLALLLYHQENYDDSIYWLKKAAQQDHTLSQHFLSILYLHGRGIKKNYRLSSHWMRRAADKNHPSSEYNMGIFYKRGLGVPQDDDIALHWIRRSAKHGLPKGISYLNDFQQQRESFPHNLGESLLSLADEEDLETDTSRHVESP